MNISGKTIYKNEQYYYKMLSLDYAINELIVSKLAKQINLTAPKIHICYHDGCYYVLSYDMANYGTFRLASDYSINYFKDPINSAYNIDWNYTSLYKIWGNFEYNFGPSIELMEEVIKMYLFDLFINSSDRHGDNWGIITNDQGERHVAIIDNEIAFDNRHVSLLTSQFDTKEYTKDVDKINEVIILQKEITHFLKESSEEFWDLFANMLDILTVDNFKKVLNEVEKEFILTDNGTRPIKIKNKKKLINCYQITYSALNMVWENNKNEYRR